MLDNTGVHPESYGAAKELLKLCGFGEDDVKNGSLSGLADKVAALGEESVAQQIGVGVPTLQDIVKELLKPGRDPRDELPPPLLRTDILELKDLKPGMELTGTVRNVIDFGAFVDIGVHQDGLVHISQICNKYIKHPSEVLKVGDIVKVWVLNADPVKKTDRLDHERAEAISQPCFLTGQPCFSGGESKRQNGRLGLASRLFQYIAKGRQAAGPHLSRDKQLFPAAGGCLRPIGTEKL